jgi:hypothetical protein
MKTKRILFASFFCVTLPVFTLGVQLENWRFPYYDIASRLGYFSPSPSGMFWDDLGKLDSGRTFLDPALWPDSALYKANHWNLEPAVSYNVDNTDVYYGKNSDFHLSALNDIRFGKFLTRQVLDVDSRYRDDPGFLGNTGRFAAGRISEAFLQYGFDHGFVRLGRITRNWGPFADRSLILSANPYSYDGLELGLHSSIFEFRHMFAAFPVATDGRDFALPGAGRYFTAHSLDFMLGRFGSVGITETVVFGRESGVPDIQYVNPISIYFVTNTNGEGKGNLMECFQWDIHPFIDNIAFKGQVLIDDIQIDNNGPSDQKPNHWGTDLGLFWSDFLKISMPHVLSLEYHFLSRWVYTVSDDNTSEGERYTYLGRSLGYPADDGDNINLCFTLSGKKYWAGQAGLSYNRKGQGTIMSLWHDDSLSQVDPSKYARDALGYRNEPHIPSGIVEGTFDLYVNLIGYFKNFADLQAAIHLRQATNKNNVPASAKFDPRISLTVNLHYSNFFIPLPK